jgi:hypothetical protein
MGEGGIFSCKCTWQASVPAPKVHSWLVVDTLLPKAFRQSEIFETCNSASISVTDFAPPCSVVPHPSEHGKTHHRNQVFVITFYLLKLFPLYFCLQISVQNVSPIVSNNVIFYNFFPHCMHKVSIMGCET